MDTPQVTSAQLSMPYSPRDECNRCVCGGGGGGRGQECVNCVTNLSSIQLRKRPLTAGEFVAPLSKIDPIFKEEEEAYKVT